MSATTGGAIKAHLEAAGTGLAWFRDRIPKAQTLPCGTVEEGLNMTEDLDGYQADADVHTIDEMVQVNVWQPWRKADGSPGEVYGLIGTVVGALKSARLLTAPTLVYGVSVRDVRRLVEVDRATSGRAYDTNDQANVIHHAITIQVRRKA